MSTIDRFLDVLMRHHRAVYAMGVAMLVLSGFAFVSALTAQPAWCDWPSDDASLAALRYAENEQAATIARYSPGQPIDRLTIRMSLLTQCAEGAR